MLGHGAYNTRPQPGECPSSEVMAGQTEIPVLLAKESYGARSFSMRTNGASAVHLAASAECSPPSIFSNKSLISCHVRGHSGPSALLFGPGEHVLGGSCLAQTVAQFSSNSPRCHTYRCPSEHSNEGGTVLYQTSRSDLGIGVSRFASRSSY